LNNPPKYDCDVAPAGHNLPCNGSERLASLQNESQKLTVSDIAYPLIVLHLIAFCAFVPSFVTWFNVGLMIACSYIFGQGINLGYHRLLTHRSLSVPRWLEYFYVILALCCVEETPAKWVSTHRRHHNHSDHDDDPHSPSESFFWSHIGWLLVRRNGVNEFRNEEKYSADIMKDPFYSFLERHPLLPGGIYLLHAIIFYSACFACCWAMGTTDPAWSALGMTMWGVFLRTVVVWHSSWSVNSLTHRFGYQNYETGEQSRNNWLVAIAASGEGWHNNHHHDPASANNQHRWWEFDPTYYQIRILMILGLAKNVIQPRHLRKADPSVGGNPSSITNDSKSSDGETALIAIPQRGENLQSNQEQLATKVSQSILSVPVLPGSGPGTNTIPVEANTPQSPT
jgi:stearoyl-CoA desaturase (delta-9 desaturase)